MGQTIHLLSAFLHNMGTVIEINDYIDFPGVRQVFVIRRETFDLKKNKNTEEIACGLTSRDSGKVDPARLLAANRNHWALYP